MTNKTVSLTDLNTANEDVLVQKLQVSLLQKKHRTRRAQRNTKKTPFIS